MKGMYLLARAIRGEGGYQSVVRRIKKKETHGFSGGRRGGGQNTKQKSKNSGGTLE